MITANQFHFVYSNLPFGDLDVEAYLYQMYLNTTKMLLQRSNNQNKINSIDSQILDYVIQEFVYSVQDLPKEKIYELINDKNRNKQFLAIVSDKIFFNEINPYQAVSLLSHQSPVISTMELNINFIINRITAIKNKYEKKDIVLDMMVKAFLMFKSVNYLLSSGFETEAFSTWRTVHELECVIKVLFDNPDIIPTYLRHIVYNNAFRNEFDDKDEQQATIDELKMHMKAHDLKSKDMKKYIEYGYLFSIKDVETRYENFKLNFRNGLENVAGLSDYSSDYEMSSEVAHSSPLLIYSNKMFFREITIVRSYESFLRLEAIFYEMLKSSYQDVDSKSYEGMRNLYLGFAKRILIRETIELNKLLLGK